MNIYRIEKDGTGPYCFGSPIGRYLQDKHQNSARHPSPASDGIPWYVVEIYHYGFASLESMLEWFVDELEILKQHGFVVAIYACEVVEIGEKQVAFDRDESELVGEILL